MHQHHAGLVSRSNDSPMSAQIPGAAVLADTDYRSCWSALPAGIRSRIEQASGASSPGHVSVGYPMNDINPLALAA